jgi:hypothetical protein
MIDPQIDDDDDDFVEEDPTDVAYGELRAAFEHFSIDLFDSALPVPLITLQRRRNSYGHFAAGRFKRADAPDIINEIALNPQKWRMCTVEDNLSTLVHEMCHLQQHCFGTPADAAITIKNGRG